jgi:pyridoxine kinase
MNLLSINSHVAYGHVGNAAAVFALQRLGCEVWPVHTVLFSNHAGHGSLRGEMVEASAVGDLVRGIEERGVLAGCDGVLSGYLGKPETGEAILEAFAKVKAANPAARYCCDPVIGDAGRGVYVRAGIPEFLRERAVPAADVLTPNQFELEHLSGGTAPTLAALLAAADALAARGPRAILVTSVATEETPKDCIDLIAREPAGRFRLRTPGLPVAVHGAGDAVAALFFLHWLRTGSAAEALSRAASSIFGVLQKTAEAGADEMLLIDAQEELVKPSRMFLAEPV